MNLKPPKAPERVKVDGHGRRALMVQCEVNLQMAGNDSDERPACEGATSLPVPLDVDPMVDHERHKDAQAGRQGAAW